MIGIVISYFERFHQLCRTLHSIEEHGGDYHIVIVDDGSSVPLELDGFEILYMKDKDWTLQMIAINRGIERCLELGCDKIMLNGAECYHSGNVIERAMQVTDNEYISFACYSIDKDTTFGQKEFKTLDRPVKKEGECGWYNHSKYRPNAYDWCACMTSDNWVKLNGYDERFAYGVAMGDTDFVKRVGLAGLDITIVDDPFVVHQWHYDKSYVHPHNHPELFDRNIKLAAETNHYRATHLKTPDFDKATV